MEPPFPHVSLQPRTVSRAIQDCPLSTSQECHHQSPGPCVTAQYCPSCFRAAPYHSPGRVLLIMQCFVSARGCPYHSPKLSWSWPRIDPIACRAVLGEPMALPLQTKTSLGQLERISTITTSNCPCPSAGLAHRSPEVLPSKPRSSQSEPSLSHQDSKKKKKKKICPVLHQAGAETVP